MTNKLKMTYVAISVLLLGSQLSMGSVMAQQLQEISPEAVQQLSQSELSKAFVQHRSKIDGKYEPEKLSKSRAFRSVLRSLVNYKEQLSTADYNKLLAQSSIQKIFIQNQRAQMVKQVQVLCNDFNHGFGELNVAEFAKNLSNIADKADRSSDKHYESVIGALSEEGQMLIADNIIPEKLSRTVHSKVDLVAVAEQNPHIVRASFEDICQSSQNIDTATQIEKTTTGNKDGIGTIMRTTEFGQKKDNQK